MLLRPQTFQQATALRAIMGFPRRQRKAHRVSLIRGNQMNFGIPAAPRLANGLQSPFFRAPAPSGCTFTLVLSNAITSTLTRMTPFLLQGGENPIQHAAFGPAVHPSIDRVPVAEAFGQSPPLAPVLVDVEDGVQYPQVGDADVAPLHRKSGARCVGTVLP